jgi:hypothetical protein
MEKGRPPQFGTRALLVAVAVVAVALGAWVNSVDPLGKALGMLFGQYTIYAEDYSDYRWNRIRVGMSKPEVAKILGNHSERLTRTGGSTARGTRIGRKTITDGSSFSSWAKCAKRLPISTSTEFGTRRSHGNCVFHVAMTKRQAE